MNACACNFFVLFPLQETGKAVNGLYLTESDFFFPLFYVYLLYEIKKEKEAFSSPLSINQKTGMTLKRWLNISDPMEIAQKENVYGVALLKSKELGVFWLGFFFNLEG